MLDKKILIGAGVAAAAIAYYFYNKHQQAYDTTKAYVLSNLATWQSSTAKKLAELQVPTVTPPSSGNVGVNIFAGAESITDEEVKQLMQAPTTTIVENFIGADSSISQQLLQASIPQAAISLNTTAYFTDLSTQINKLTNTVNSNVLTLKELNSVSDYFRIMDNSYVGTLSSADVINNGQAVFKKYGINIQH